MVDRPARKDGKEHEKKEKNESTPIAVPSPRTDSIR